MKLQSNAQSLRNLFDGSRQIEVPDFQRNYAWEADQVDAFLKDIFEVTKSGEEHFFGPVVLLEDSPNKYELIDGQQRVTTAIVFLCLIRDFLANLDDTLIHVGTATQDIKSMVDSVLYSSDLTKQRFTPNYQIRSVFRSHILAHPKDSQRKYLTSKGAKMTDKERTATKALRAAYFRLDRALKKWIRESAGSDQVEQKKQIHKLINALTTSMELLSITVFSQDDAYVLFETLNDRGLRLTPADLLKSFTLKNIQANSSQDDFENALKKWDEAIDYIGVYPFTKFLRHYLLTQVDDKVQSKKIFKIFDTIIRSQETNGALKNLDNIHDAAEAYAQLLGVKHKTGHAALDETLKNLNLISETHRIFLLQVFLKGYDADERLKAARAVEILAFRWIVDGLNAQDLESLYQKMAHMLSEDASSNALDLAIKFGLDELPNDDSIEREMTHGEAKADLQFYVLKKINRALTGSELVWDRTLINIEHLAPQSPEPGSSWHKSVAPSDTRSEDEPDYSDFVNRWGNLTLLEFEINKSIQNAEWATKLTGKADKSGLNSSKIELTLNLCGLSDWDRARIESRSEWIAKTMVNLSSKRSLESSNDSVKSYIEDRD
jgi:uncharacterized protein with ParB-like and HNH nuclease domain